jgi:hypothetical protein
VIEVWACDSGSGSARLFLRLGSGGVDRPSARLSVGRAWRPWKFTVVEGEEPSRCCE